MSKQDLTPGKLSDGVLSRHSRLAYTSAACLALFGAAAHASHSVPASQRGDAARRSAPSSKSSAKGGRPKPAVKPSRKPPPPKPSSEASFVTEGWAIERRFDADLDADGARDRVLVLLQRDADKTEFRRRSLVILLRRDDGYILGGSNDKLINCLDCGGVRGGDGSPQLEVQRGSLVVTQNIGSREYSAYTSRLRWSAERTRFELIGEDSTRGDAITGEVVTISCNLLTSACIETKTPPQVDDDGNERRIPSKKRYYRLPSKPPLSLEDVPANDW